MRHFTILLALLTATPLFADATFDVRNAEIAFAKAFADRDQAKFFAFVADDATFLGPRRTMSGKAEVVKVWSGFFKSPEAPFRWGPERVSVSADGTVGLSTGPVYDAAGKPAGSYISTWRKQSDGSWRVVFDGPGAPPPYMPEDAPPVEEGFVAVDDGVKLHYRKIGRAPLTLIVPLGSWLYGDFRQLADVATVVTYDMRNRGRSEHVENVKTLTIQQDVKDMEAVRRQLKIEKFVPVGFSYLGLMVALYALDHPDRVSRIVQLGPVAMKWDAFEPHGIEDSGAPAPVAAQPNADQRALCEARWSVTKYYLLGNPAHHTRLTSPCALSNEWPANLGPGLEHHWDSVKNLKIMPDDVKKITVPVLTIHGTKDRNAAYEGGRQWAALLPDARLVTVEGAAHMSWTDDPVTVFGSIRQFLRGEWPLGAERVSR